MSPASSKIRVAISGGGLAGALLIHGLLEYDHLDVQIFESAPAFKESGMAIGVTRNAYQALELIGPSAVQCLDKADSILHHGIYFLLAQGPNAGEMADEIDSKKDGKRLTNIVHRASFLKEILAPVPAARMHAGRKLDRVDRENDGSLTIHFTDGSTHACDVLVGADGVHSPVRKIILGDTDPASTPTFAGWVGHVSLQPREKMREILGEESLGMDDPREWAWLGDGAFIMYNVLSGGEQVQFIATIKEDNVPQTSLVPVQVTRFTEKYRDWPQHLREALTAVLGDDETVNCWNMHEHLPAKTYIDGPVCMIGDAAHTTTPWQASGGGTAIEDVLVLSTLLGRSKSPADACKALKIYDEVRRPRTSRVVKSSHDTGLAFCGLNPEYPLTMAGLSGRFRKRWDFILDFDNAKARNEAVELFDAR